MRSNASGQGTRKTLHGTQPNVYEDAPVNRGPPNEN